MESYEKNNATATHPPQRRTASGASNDDASARVPTKVDEW
tara:strand:+ start:1822 stop:1941 length:120 start_codon:yes stop_codon:yes gene_type:complete